MPAKCFAAVSRNLGGGRKVDKAVALVDGGAVKDAGALGLAPQGASQIL